MASAYRNANRGSDESDSDMSEVEINGHAGSDTDASDASDASEEQTPALAQLPVELRNRILMLTSRGVSHR